MSTRGETPPSRNVSADRNQAPKKRRGRESEKEENQSRTSAAERRAPVLASGVGAVADDAALEPAPAALEWTVAPAGVLGAISDTDPAYSA